MLFQDFFGPEGWTPLQNNVAVCMITILYGKLIFQVVQGGSFSSSNTTPGRRNVTSVHHPLHHHHHHHHNLYFSKQIIYMLLSASILFWPLYDRSSWSWRLNIVLPSAILVRVFYKGFIDKDPNDIEVQTLSRSSVPSELLFGPFQYMALLVGLGLYRFMTDEAAIIMAAVGIGDAVAPMVGSFYGRHVYQMPFAPIKTMEGSVCGVFLGTCSASYFFLYGLGRPFLPLRIILAYAGIAALVEGTTPGHMDNLAVPIILHFSMDRVIQWLPS
jgi:phytol kinase